MTYTEFGKQVFAAFDAIADSLQQFPARSVLPVPANWIEGRATLRRVAEDLMICTDLAQVVATLREDQATLTVVAWLAMRMKHEDLLLTIRRAFAETAEPSENLPGQPLAAVLLEISTWTEPPRTEEQ